MGLDVYVGSLTRYHSGDWETVVQKHAREQGLPLTVVRAYRAEDDEPPDQDEVRETVLRWRGYISHGIKVPLDWDESPESPYFTDKPAWDGYASLVVWAAYNEHPDLTKPEKSVEDWTKDPAYLKSTTEGFKTQYPHLLHNVEYWLPADFEFMFQSEDVVGNQVTFGSSPQLLRELEELNRSTWQADEEQLSKWRFEGCEYGSPLETAARFGFSIFYELAQKSVLHKLVMKLDY